MSSSFDSLVSLYGDHQRSMQSTFGNPSENLRQMTPDDVTKLSDVELAGLMYWIETQPAYGLLSNEEDKTILLQRYSVRKLSLDHYYSAAKHPDYVSRREFVMNNYTYVPSDRTGFELPDDDEFQISAKRSCFSATFSKFWTNVVDRFVEMKITDADIVFLQTMLLWSDSHNCRVSSEMTRQVMKTQREWAIASITDYYSKNRVEAAEERLGQLILIIGDLEDICELHCEDFVVAKLFDLGEQQKFWYDTMVYTPVNMKLNILEEKMELMEEEEDKENIPPKSIKQADPPVFNVNTHKISDIMAPLPDDVCYKNLNLFLSSQF
uniref:NR LBD domain-containing protein n=1 Tax=Caenorhabditis tropicalis TaxID=1561998 RepID=A0A1I7V3A2_9PELO